MFFPCEQRSLNFSDLQRRQTILYPLRNMLGLRISLQQPVRITIDTVHTYGLHAYVPPATIPTPMKTEEQATCICGAIAAPDDIPDTDILLRSTLYDPIQFHCTSSVNIIKHVNNIHIIQHTRHYHVFQPKVKSTHVTISWPGCADLQQSMLKTTKQNNH